MTIQAAIGSASCVISTIGEHPNMTIISPQVPASWRPGTATDDVASLMEAMCYLAMQDMCHSTGIHPAIRKWLAVHMSTVRHVLFTPHMHQVSASIVCIFRTWAVKVVMCIATCLIIVCGLVAAHHSASNDPPPGASRAPSKPAQVRLVAGAVPGMYEAHHLYHHQAT